MSSKKSRPRVGPFPKRGPVTLANGDVYPINRGGTFVRVRQANQTFTIRVDDDTEWTAEQNDEFGPFEIEDAFKKLEIVNDSGGSLTVQLEIGYGRISTSSSAISGTVKVDDDETQALLTTIDSVLDTISTNISAMQALLTNDQDKRKSLTPIGANSYASQTSNGTNNVVTSGANTSGVIIRWCQLIGDYANTNVELRIGGNVLMSASHVGGSGSVSGLVATMRDVFVEPGEAVQLYVGGSSGEAYIDYEVL